MISYFTSGTLTIRLGNLIKVVTIRKKPSINMGGVLNSDYSAASFVQGDWDENPTWSRFATNNIMNGLDTRRVQNPSGGIWMRFDRNVGLTNTPRSIKGYVTSTDSKGRSRIVVTQESGVLNYVSGVPSLPILSTSTLFVVNVKTDLPGWVIKARDLNMQPFPITLGAKTSPIAGTPSNCYIPVTVASNPGVERTIYLYLCASEDPSIEIYFASLIQQALPPSISISSGGPANIPYTSGVYTTTVTSAYAWNIVDATYNSVITPNTGAAGTTNVSISVPLNSGISQRNIRVVFNTTFGGYTAQTTWTANQLANPYPSDSYIPRNTLIAAGWPSGKLPAIGLQVAVRGNKILPGGTPDMNDMKVQWKTTNTTTSGVDIIIGLSVPNSGLGTGKSGTDAMIAAGVSAHPAAKYCRDMGPEWYFPSVAEVALIYNNSAILGNSYQLGSVFYWCNSQYNTGGGVLWEFGGDLYVNDKVSEWYVRCVRNI